MALRPKESGRLIAQLAKHVKIQREGIETLGDLIIKNINDGSLSIERFSQHEIHPSANNPKALDWICVVDTLNFCFWHRDKEKGWMVNGYTGYFALCAAINRAVEENVDILNPKYYSQISKDQLQHILRSDTNVDIPLFEERLKCLHEVGNALVKNFNGSFKNCVLASQKSAMQLLRIIVHHFKCFQDEAFYQDYQVALYKRAQILVGDVWACYRGEDLGRFDDINEITMFADYRVPQSLLYFNVLKYSSALLDLLNKDVVLENGSEMEVEIRGCSIEAVSLLTNYVKSRIKPEKVVNSILIDHFLWDFRRKYADKILTLNFNEVVIPDINGMVLEITPVASPDFNKFSLRRFDPKPENLKSDDDPDPVQSSSREQRSGTLSKEEISEPEDTKEANTCQEREIPPENGEVKGHWIRIKFHYKSSNIKNFIGKILQVPPNKSGEERFLESSKKLHSIPGPLSVPGIGTLYQYLPFFGPYQFDRLHHNGLKKFNRYGAVVHERIVPGCNIIWLFKPEDIEIMFRCEGKYPQRRSHLALEKYRLDRPNVYNTGGLLPTNGHDWLRLRSIFQKGLSSPSAVHNFLPDTNDIIQEWLIRLGDVCKMPNVNYLDELSRLFLELICLVALDLRMNSFSTIELRSNSRSSKLMRAALTTNSCILKTDNGPQLWRKFETPLYKKLRKSQEFMEEVAIDLLSLKMSFFKETDKPGSLLESYLSNNHLDFKDIIGMVCDFLLAGIDTTSYTTSFILYHLSRNRLCQSALYQECKKLLPKPDTPITKDILSQAQYAKAVIKESLRLRPISVGIGRILDKDAQFSGFTVPRGTVVVSQNQVSSRLKEYFIAPNEFRPERWLKDHQFYQQPHPFLVIPFGHGARSCIARRLAEQNMLTFIMKLTRNFKYRWNGTELDTKSLLINKPDGPISLTMEKRL
ncbi:hypothetical protein FQA39_LY11948 [Lamprigera yunnana]|nr:hypothetical protein FQA39_LY11948 [Lamprigera yunnana]